jgi:hypothetical protein
MDKQFARILMLSVLLPAGAALAEAIQHEHISFAPMDQSMTSNIPDIPSTEVVRETGPASENQTASENKSKTALKDDKSSRDVAYGGESVSDNVR